MSNVPDLVKEANGFSTFNPMQQKVLDAPWTTHNLVVASPTASGKTIIAELVGLESILNRKKKAMYTGPLRALASEHYNDLKKKYGDKHQIKFAVSTGELDSSSKYLSNFDFIFSTFEKLDSLLIHRAEWLQQIGVLIIDEVHELDSDRGATLEMIITKLRILNPKIQIVALSATIPNADELATWLKAELVESTYRPVPLKEGVHFHQTIVFKGDEQIELAQEDPFEGLLGDTMKQKKQALIFANTRPRAESLAKQTSIIIAPFLTPEEKKQLEKVAVKVENALENATEQCKKLASLIKQGVAFHHAGLVAKQRELVEDNFRSGLIKTISATPTLCITPQTRIWNGKEEVKVEDFSVNGTLLALKGSKIVQINAQDVVKIPNERDIVTIRTTSGRQLAVTENHQLLIKRGKNRIAVPAAECKLGDRVATVRQLPPPEGSAIRIGDFSPSSPHKDSILQTDDFYVIGAMLGDGYSGAETKNEKIFYKAEPCIVGRDPEIFDKILSFSQRYGLHTRQRDNAYGVPCIFFGKNKWCREFWVRCGIEKGEKKYIAKELLTTDIQSIRALLQGILDTDGYVTKNKGVGFSNISIELVQQVQKALLFFGIVTRLREREPSEMKIEEKTYKTKKCYEIVIEQKRSTLDFREKVGFGLTRKKEALDTLCTKLQKEVNYYSCAKCNYQLHNNLFDGRTKMQRQWGSQKRQIIEQLGNNGPATSAELQKELGFIPYKGEKRLDHHLALISREKQGSSKIWKLNQIGTTIFQQVIAEKQDVNRLFSQSCPICGEKLDTQIRENWRKSDFEGDIFWDFINNITIEGPEKHPFVYDVVLPSNNSNDHYFAAEGFLIHNSAGVNLPAFRVIITSVQRFDFSGMKNIPVREYRQMAGRSGRPKYDKFGESIVLCKTEMEAEEVMRNYILGEMENIQSKLGVQPVLRMHLLALIASKYIFDVDSMDDFFARTFYAQQYQDLDNLKRMLRGLVKELYELEFIDGEENRFWATKIGQRVAELYLDPLSASALIKKLKRDTLNAFAVLFAITDTTEIRPYVNVSAKKEPEIWEEIQLRWEDIPLDDPNSIYSDGQIADKFQTAKFLEAWMSEMPEQELLEQYNVAPGLIRHKLQKGDWLLYGLAELAPLVGKPQHVPLIAKMRKRLDSGIKEELILLCELRGIGRVRARRMFNVGIKNVSDVKKTRVEDLSKVLGAAVAMTIKSQLGDEFEKGTKKKIEAQLRTQKTLFD